MFSPEGNRLDVDFPIKDIPQGVVDEVCSQLRNYSVPIFGLSPNKPDPKLSLIGSGTLVEIEGKHSILTVAHVWYGTRSVEEVGLTFTDYPSYSFVRMPRAGIRVRCLWNEYDSDWGPDLALLEFPSSLVSTVAAHKSFVNLPQQRAMLASFAPNIEKGLWAVIGMVDELSSILFSEQEQTTKASVHGRAFFLWCKRVISGMGMTFLISVQRWIFLTFHRTFTGLVMGALGGWTNDGGVRKTLLGWKSSLPRCRIWTDKNLWWSQNDSLPWSSRCFRQGLGGVGIP